MGWIIAWLAGSVVGLYVAGLYPRGFDATPGILLFGLSVTAVAAAVLGRQEKQARWFALFAVAALAGCANALLRNPPVTEADIAYYNGSPGEILVTGLVVGEPVYLDTYQRVQFRVEEMRLPGETGSRTVKGDLLTLLPRYPERVTGERLSLSGELTPPPALTGFDYTAYLARQGIRSYMRFPRSRSLGPQAATGFARLIGDSRASVRSALRRNIPEPQAAIAVGVVVGDRTSMPEPLREAFQRSGTTHVLAISGQNISLLAGFLWLVYGGRTGSRRMPLWLAACALLLLAFYTAFTGANPPVVRAAVMSAVLLLAPNFGRRYDPTSALAVSAFVMSLLDPDVLFDGGFLLSFAAMTGIAHVSPLLYHGLKRIRVPGWLALVLSASLGAQLTTIPLIVLLTGSVSLVAPLATLSVDFALLPLMLAGILTGIADSLLPGLGYPFGLFTWLFAAWMVWCVRLWSSLPWAAVNVALHDPGLPVLYYTALGAVTWSLTSGRKHLVRLAAWKGGTAVALAGGGFALWLVLLGLVLGR